MLHLHLICILRKWIPVPQGTVCCCQFASHGWTPYGRALTRPCRCLFGKESSWRWKQLFKAGDSSEAITLGLVNDYLLKTASAWDGLQARSLAALSGTRLETAQAGEVSVGLQGWQEARHPAEGKSSGSKVQQRGKQLKQSSRTSSLHNSNLAHPFSSLYNLK